MTGELDLQEALKLYRRQGVVASQDKHLGRTLGSGLYPISARGDAVRTTEHSVYIELKEPPKAEGVDAVAIGVRRFGLLLKTTTTYKDVDLGLNEAVGIGVRKFGLVLKDTTTFKDIDLGLNEAVGIGVRSFGIKLSKLPLEHPDRDVLYVKTPIVGGSLV